MERMEFLGEITLDEIYEQNKDIIYSNIIKSIKAVIDDVKVDRIEVMEFSRNETNFTIDLKRSQFIGVLNSAREYYISEELYEKCAGIKDIIKRLNAK